MAERAFVDSNIWLYAILADPRHAEKRAVARTLTAPGGVVSTQVIAEVCAVLIKKGKFNEQQLQKVINSFYRRCVVVEINQSLLLAASELRAQYRFSYWDSLIVSAALAANSNVLYSEDMQHGMQIDRLRIVNPL